LRSHGLVALLGLLIATFASALSAADANQLPSYALRLPLVTVPGAALQRVELSAQVLAGLQTADYRDIRIFNAQGQPVPMALGAGSSPIAAQAITEQQVTLPAYPILGEAGSRLSTLVQPGLSLRIEEKNGRREVQISTGPAGGGQVAPAASNQQVLGALFDTRQLGAAVVSLALDMDLPPAQPIAFQVASSQDLTNWSPLASTVLYRAPAQGASGATQLGSSSIALPGIDLKNQYLRITWTATQGGQETAANVTLRGATLTTSRGAASVPAPRPTVQLTTPALNSAHQLGFSLPFATPVAAIGIAPQGSNVLIPVRVLGRNDNQQPWTPLAQAVVYNLQTAGVDQRSATIPLPNNLGKSWRDIRIEADTKTPGFAAVPTVSIEFAPVQLVFLASGDAPFTLAAGLKVGNQGDGASHSYLPLASLVPGYQPSQENALPLARIDALAGGQALAPASVQAPELSSQPTAKTLVLWGVLLAAVVALALMAWTLLRQTPKMDSPDAG